jgi:hypothetical protein
MEGVGMNVASAGMLAVSLLCFGRAAVAAEQKTVYAVAKVDGKTKKIDGQVYHLIAIRLDPGISLLGSGLTDAVLLVGGCHGKATLARDDKETKLEDGGCRYGLLWLRLPDKGEIEVLWGALDDPKEKNAKLRDRLIKAGYVPFKVDVRKLPVVKASEAKEILAALDKLAGLPKPK